MNTTEVVKSLDLMPAGMVEAIDAMQAGYELNSYIGTMIFGWTYRMEGIDSSFYTAWSNEAGEQVNLPDYSTEPAAAWEVVAHHTNSFFLYRSSAPQDPMFWHCSFAAPEKFEAIADTAALAICRAALKAALFNQASWPSALYSTEAFA